MKGSTTDTPLSTGRLNAHDPVVVLPMPIPGGLSMIRFLKERGEAGPFLIRVDLESKPNLKFTDLDWRPAVLIQAKNRLRRRVRLNGMKLPGRYASRNEREGVYALKVNGRHTRKRRAPKIMVLDMQDEAFQRIKEQACE